LGHDFWQAIKEVYQIVWCGMEEVCPLHVVSVFLLIRIRFHNTSLRQSLSGHFEIINAWHCLPFSFLLITKCMLLFLLWLAQDCPKCALLEPAALLHALKVL
jgi:hypothetical protein